MDAKAVADSVILAAAMALVVATALRNVPNVTNARRLVRRLEAQARRRGTGIDSEIERFRRVARLVFVGILAATVVLVAFAVYAIWFVERDPTTGYTGALAASLMARFLLLAGAFAFAAYSEGRWVPRLVALARDTLAPGAQTTNPDGPMAP